MDTNYEAVRAQLRGENKIKAEALREFARNLRARERRGANEAAKQAALAAAAIRDGFVRTATDEAQAAFRIALRAETYRMAAEEAEAEAVRLAAEGAPNA